MRSFPWQAIALLSCIALALAGCASRPVARSEAEDFWWTADDCSDCDWESSEEDFSGSEAEFSSLEGERAEHLRFIEAYLSRVEGFRNVTGEIAVELFIQPSGEVTSATVERSNVQKAFKDFQDEVLLSLVFRDFPPAPQTSAQRVCLQVRFEKGLIELQEVPSQGLVSLSSLGTRYPALYE
ncbi:MAG: hypothetical protein AB1405_03895 [Bdellovibrionota bacterium]